MAGTQDDNDIAANMGQLSVVGVNGGEYDPNPNSRMASASLSTLSDDNGIAANMVQLSFGVNGGEYDPNSPDLLTLSDDVLFSILLYAGPNGVENAKFVCRRLHTATEDCRH